MGNCRGYISFGFNGYILIIRFFNENCLRFLENQSIEKRIAITPEIAKKYISFGFEVFLSKNYGAHLGIADEEYQNVGVKTSNDEKEILNDANVIVQMGLLSDDKCSLLKQDQTLIGVLNPYR